MRPTTIENLEERILLDAGLNETQLLLADQAPALLHPGTADSLDQPAIPQTLNAPLAANTLPAPELPNAPIGVAQGIFPGRVAWAYDPDAATWNGASGYHWQDANTNQSVVQNMFAKGLLAITGQNSSPAAWDALFKYSNQKRGLGSVGYTPGQKIAIKINLNVHDSQNAAPNNFADLTPAVLFSLLDQLVNQAAVPQQDIYVYDSIKSIPDKLYNKCHPDFPNVHFVDKSGGNGREKVAPSPQRVLQWSTGGGTDYLPKCVVDATYMINLAIVKKHDSGGITGCAKNHFGSFLRRPDESGSFNAHDSLALNDTGSNKYRALVDLLGHKDLGGKTILNIVDGIYGGWNWGTSDSQPTRWVIAPFNNNWLSSLFMSQDAIAIDSVLVDFLRSEDDACKAQTGRYHGPNVKIPDSVDDYLHEAANCGQPGARRYDPEGDGTGLTSLGAHEHWNNVADKQYSRNLGTAQGIELLQTKAPANLQPATIPDAQQDSPFLPIIFRADSPTPLTWTVSAGSLPPGMNLDPPSGLYSGTPTSPDAFQFTVTATNLFGSASITCSHLITPNPAPTIHGTAGNDGFRLRLDPTQTSLEVYNDATSQLIHQFQLASLQRLTINAAAGDDAVVLDLENGLPIPPGGVHFDGGQDNDTLVVLGVPPATSLAVTPASVTFGLLPFSGSSIEDVQVHLLGQTLLTSLDITGGLVSLSGIEPTVLRTENLSLTGHGALDLANSTLIVAANSQTRRTVYDHVANAIRRARQPDGWRSLGLTTSQAGPYTALAAALTTNDVIVKFTYDGDANLDGIVNADDYFLIDTGFITQPGLYSAGDFNYDGVVNADDYFLIDSAFIGQGAILARTDPPRPLASPPTAPPRKPDPQPSLFADECDPLA